MKKLIFYQSIYTIGIIDGLNAPMETSTYEDRLVREVKCLIYTRSTIVFTELVRNGLITTDLMNKVLDNMNDEKNPNVVLFNDDVIDILKMIINISSNTNTLKKILNRHLYWTVKNLADVKYDCVKKMIVCEYPSLISSSFILLMNDMEFFEEYLFDWFNNLPMDKIEKHPGLEYINHLNLIKMMNKTNRSMGDSFLSAIILNKSKLLTYPNAENQDIYAGVFSQCTADSIKACLFQCLGSQSFACWTSIILNIDNIEIEFTFNESLIIFYCLARYAKISNTKWERLHPSLSKYIPAYISRRIPVPALYDQRILSAIAYRNNIESFNESYFNKTMTAYLDTLEA